MLPLLLVVSKLIGTTLSYSSQSYRTSLIAETIDCPDLQVDFDTANKFSASLNYKSTDNLLYLFWHAAVSGSSFPFWSIVTEYGESSVLYRKDR